MFEGVRQSLLHDAVDRELHPAVEGVDVTGRTVDDLQAGGAYPFAQRVDVREAGLRAQFGLGRRAVRLAQDTEYPAQFAQGLATGVADEVQGFLSSLRGCGGGVGRPRRRG